MRNVEVKLPPGLAQNVVDHGITWSLQKGQEKPPLHSPSDEELLLEKMPGLKSNVDSSGCSSAPESVSSSLDSNKTMSADSGTEQPDATSTDDLRNNSLCLRSITQKPISANMFTPGSYSILGVTLNPPNDEPETTYIPLPIPCEINSLPYAIVDEKSKPSPYVLHGDIIKMDNTDYLPLNFTEAIEKHRPAYVMTGNKGILNSEMICNNNLEDKPAYVRVADCANGVPKGLPETISWPHHNFDKPLNKGYVSVGDVPAPVKPNIGYIPHRHFDAKTIKDE